MINLHMHTNKSDGVLEPIELLKLLEKNDIKIASITDHDSVDAYIGLDIDKYYSGKLIKGSEIKCIFDGYIIEVLGYNLDINKIKPYLDNQRKKVYDFQYLAYKRGKELFDKYNLKYDDKDLEYGKYAGTALYDLLDKYHEYNEKILGEDMLSSRSSFYRLTLSNPNSPFYVSEEGISDDINTVIDKIHKSGGIAFLAHIGQYKSVLDKIKFLVDISSNTKIDGIECYYPLHSEEDTNKYIEFCKNNNLLISGGSDFHGTSSQNILFQNNIDISNLDWINKEDI